MSGKGNNFEDAASEAGPKRAWRLKGAARHAVGLILLLCVVVFWTSQNFLASSILANDSYAKPFFITYVNTSLFSINLAPILLRRGFKSYQNGTILASVRSFFSRRTLKAFLGKESDLETSQRLERSALLRNGAGHDDLSASAMLNAANTFRSEYGEDNEYLGLNPTARLSIVFCLIWFAANYFSSASLKWTTVSSASIISATCSIWCLLIGTITRTEVFTWRKGVGVLFALSGVILISRLDFMSGITDEPDNAGIKPHLTRNNNMTITASPDFSTAPEKTVAELALGDFIALISAVAYGLYTITLKRAELTAYPKDLHMPTFFGFVGLFNALILLPALPVLHYTGIEPFALPPTKSIWGVVLVNAATCWLGDQMWAYAMIFTSPLVCTVGLSLNIPLALIGETVLHGEAKGLMYWVGGMIVVLGFIFVEREEVKEEKEAEVEYCRSLEASMILGVEPGPESGYGTMAPDLPGSSSGYKTKMPEI